MWPLRESLCCQSSAGSTRVPARALKCTAPLPGGMARCTWR
jgi:hypothetical protein